ncbi:MAG: sigma-70 family RNA polymerase sigma factor [bacterium]|nr:sigma-70 family RNA polymerase sigma factor [bacterium]
MHPSKDYTNDALARLRDQQVRYAPREVKIEQVERAEDLLNEIDPERTYSYEYLRYRITDYRPDTEGVGETMPGDEVHHDLRLFVEDVSEAANLKAEEAGEPILTIDELSKMFNVSTKTISRWRNQGLVSRRFIVDGRRRVGFLSSSVDRFVKGNRERVSRGERFSQLSDSEKADIIERARRLVRAGGCPSEVTRRIADQMGRSVETIRYTIKQHDEKHRELAVFPSTSGPLTPEQTKDMYVRYRRGETVDALAKRYCRTRATVYRVVNDMRAERIMKLPLDFMPNEMFADESRSEEFLGPLPENEGITRRTKAPAGLPPYLTALYDSPLLNREQEQHLFRKYNYIKYHAANLREALDESRPKASEMDEIELWYAKAIEVKNLIVRSNLRLVVSIAKRHVTPTEDFFQLVSDGNMSLIRAVEKFDFGRGFKFSTYASWAIMKNFARTIPEEFKHRDRFRTVGEELFSGKEDQRTDAVELETLQNAREKQVKLILSALDEREQKIIISRFGLDHSQEPQTLKQVGAEMGVTKERIRQIEARALNKLRAAAAEEKIDIPE